MYAKQIRFKDKTKNIQKGKVPMRVFSGWMQLNIFLDINLTCSPYCFPANNNKN